MIPKQKTKIISTPAELRSAIEAGCYDYHILLAGGYIRSSKYIHYNKETKKFEVWNLADDSVQMLSERDINDKRLTNIGEAMRKGVFIRE